MKGFGQPHRLAIEGEHREPLVAVVANPDRTGAKVGGAGKDLQALGGGTLADDGDIGLQAQHGVELAMQRHAAIPGGQPHVGFPSISPVAKAA